MLLQKISQKYIAACLAIVMILSLLSPAAVFSAENASNSEGSEKYVTVSVEKFTLGQGYVVEPIIVSFEEGDRASDLITELLGAGNYKSTGSIESWFYLSGIHDPNAGAVNIPAYILNAIGEPIGDRKDEDWLQAFDYYTQSGWFLLVNNAFPDTGTSDTFVKEDDVYRFQYSLYGYGEDIGSSYGDAPKLIDPADKDALTKKIAEINSSSDKSELLLDESVQLAYDNAYVALSNMESSQAVVDEALEELVEALPIDTTELEAAVKAAKLQKNSLKISIDGSDVELSKYWVTEEVYSQYAELIEAAQALIADETARQYTIDAKVLALEQAYDNINNAKQQGTKAAIDINAELNKHLAFLENSVSNPTFGTGNGEWSILTLARAGYDVREGYYETYYNNVVREVASLMPEASGKPEGLLHPSRSTEHSRLILGLTAIGQNIHDVAEYDLIAALADFDYVNAQGINGPFFALIALDSHNYDIPVATEGKNQTTREKLIEAILEKEVTGGGWSLSKTADPDMTAMALQALAPYKESEAVKEAVDRAIQWLSTVQTVNGGYKSWGSENVYSVAQIVVALTSLGIDPHTDERFVKNGKSAIDNVLSYAVPSGGFSNGMATDQATYALVSYKRFLDSKTSLYNMTDVVIKDAVQNVTIPLPEDGQSITIPNDGKSYTIIVEGSDQEKQVNIELPEQAITKTFIELPANVELPQLSIVRGDIKVDFAEGIVMDSDAAKTLELISSNDKNNEILKARLIGLIQTNKQLDLVHEFITIGGTDSIQFTQGFVTITFNDMKGKEVAFIQNGQISSIQKFASNEAGLASGKSEYAYEIGNDLIVKTNHFTDFTVYSVKSSNNNGGVIVPQPTKSTIQLSIDKLSIEKGYVLTATTVEFTPGETVWDVLKRELDARNITYKYSLSDNFNSVYVESIAGDGEFDHGSGSGWMYNVNGTYPNYGVSQYKLKQGDKVQLRYTTNLGVDLGQDPLEWEEDEEKPDTDGSNPGTEEPGSEEEPEQEQKTLSDFYKDSTDVSTWAYDLILKATEKGFVTGYNGNLNPKNEMTRAEFAKLIVEVFDLQVVNGAASSFSDVVETNWFQPYVNAAYAAGIVNGYNNQFKPNDTITREEMAVMIAKALGLDSAQANNSYKDSDSIASWAQDAVADLTASKIMVGSNNQFNPKGTATREMAIVVAMRALQFSENKALK